MVTHSEKVTMVTPNHAEIPGVPGIFGVNIEKDLETFGFPMKNSLEMVDFPHVGLPIYQTFTFLMGNPGL